MSSKDATPFSGKSRDVKFSGDTGAGTFAYPELRTEIFKAALGYGLNAPLRHAIEAEWTSEDVAGFKNWLQSQPWSNLFGKLRCHPTFDVGVVVPSKKSMLKPGSSSVVWIDSDGKALVKFNEVKMDSDLEEDEEADTPQEQHDGAKLMANRLLSSLTGTASQLVEQNKPLSPPYNLIAMVRLLDANYGFQAKGVLYGGFDELNGLAWKKDEQIAALINRARKIFSDKVEKVFSKERYIHWCVMRAIKGPQFSFTLLQLKNKDTITDGDIVKSIAECQEHAKSRPQDTNGTHNANRVSASEKAFEKRISALECRDVEEARYTGADRPKFEFVQCNYKGCKYPGKRHSLKNCWTRIDDEKAGSKSDRGRERDRGSRGDKGGGNGGGKGKGKKKGKKGPE